MFFFIPFISSFLSLATFDLTLSVMNISNSFLCTTFQSSSGFGRRYFFSVPFFFRNTLLYSVFYFFSIMSSINFYNISSSILPLEVSSTCSSLTYFSLSSISPILTIFLWIWFCIDCYLFVLELNVVGVALLPLSLSCL